MEAKIRETVVESRCAAQDLKGGLLEALNACRENSTSKKIVSNFAYHRGSKETEFWKQGTLADRVRTKKNIRGQREISISLLYGVLCVLCGLTFLRHSTAAFL